MKRYSFNTAYIQAQDLYGVELTQDEFENLGLIAWGRIGNKYTRFYKYTTTPLQTELGEYYIELPCNVDIIEAVTADYEDYQKTSSTQDHSLDNESVEDYVEAWKFNTNHYYSAGKYIKYQEVDGKLYLADNFKTVNVLYKGIIVDSEGLPSLNEKEIDAIAAFVAYSKLYKKGITTMNNAIIQTAQMLKADWKNLCTQSRVAEYVNQNEMDEILNVGVSWDRKVYGKSYKPIR